MEKSCILGNGFDHQFNEWMDQLEKEILDLIEWLEFEPDSIDIWVDKDGYLLIEGVGMQPLDGIELIAHVTNGDVYFK